MPSTKTKEHNLPSPKFNIVELPLGKNARVSFLPRLPDQLLLDKQNFNELWSLIPEEPSTVTCFGKQHTPKRRFQSFGESYHFSQENHKAKPIQHNFLKKILEWVQEHSGKPYNQMLVNWYCDGSASIGPHADDESQLVEGSSIYSFSFGQERDFVIIDKKKKGEKSTFRQCFPMPNNSLVIMEGDMQKHFLHSVPLRSTKTCPGKRINVTVRWFRK